MKKQLLYTKKDSEEILPFPDDELKKLISDKFDFEIGYLPEGYNTVFLLEKEDVEDSRNDKWKVVFFNYAEKIVGADSGTITLDNIDSISDSTNTKKEIEVIKIIEGNFEEAVDSAVGLRKKMLKN